MSKTALTLSALLRATANAYPKNPAIVHDGEIINYQEFDDRVDKLSAYLVEQGIKHKESVAYLFFNQWETLAIYHAITRIGAIGVAINHRLTPVEMQYQIDETRSKILLYDESLKEIAGTLTELCATLEHFVGSDGDVTNDLANETITNIIEKPLPDNTWAESDINEDDDSGIWFTSGTTGKPKGAIVQHASSVWSATSTALSLGINNKTRLLSAAPLFHRGAMEDMHLAVTLTGGVHYMVHKFNPLDVLERIQRDKITHAFIVPTMARMMLDVPNADQFDLSSLQCWMSASAPLREDLASEIRQVFKLAPQVLTNCYGITESLLNATCLGDALIASPTRVGLPPPGMSVRVITADKSFILDDTPGELVTHGPTTLRTYLNNQEAFEDVTFEADGKLWYQTGDIGFRDAEGYVHLLDRSKDMIISGGENIYCVEVESAIAAHPEVNEIAVVGMPDKKWGEKVVAVVVRKKGALISEQGILLQCQNLANFKHPREIYFVEQLPKNSFGKVQKKEIKDLLDK